MINPPGDRSLTRFRTLAERDAGEEPDGTLFESVPDHLRDPLVRWWGSVADAQHHRRTCERILSRMRIDAQELGQSDNRLVDFYAIERALGRQDPRSLDLINAFIGLSPDWEAFEGGRNATWLQQLADLEQRLTDGGSAWTIDHDLRGLFRRVDQTQVDARRAAEASATTAGRSDAASYLQAAWRHAFGMDPDPSAAYGEAVRAVEAAAIPVVSPNNGRATLGTVIRDVRNQPWLLVLVDVNDAPGDAGPFVEMLNCLWQGQRSRHAGGASTRPQTQSEAEAAVQLAVLAVQWFTREIVYK